MAKHTRLGLTVALAASLAAGATNAQALQRPEVLGNWTLRVTPAEDAHVTIRTDNGRVEMPVTITARGASGIACSVGGEAADCQLRRGQLVIVMRMDGGRMTHTLTSRRGGGFTGATRISAPLLPFGSFSLGAANLTRP